MQATQGGGLASICTEGGRAGACNGTTGGALTRLALSLGENDGHSL